MEHGEHGKMKYWSQVHKMSYLFLTLVLQYPYSHKAQDGECDNGGDGDEDGPDSLNPVGEHHPCYSQTDH